MRPLTVLNGIIFGSCASIFVGLAVTLLLFSLMASESARLQEEIGPLAVYTGIFFGMTLVSALAFFAQLLRKSWRWAAEGVLLLAGTATVFYLLP